MRLVDSVRSAARAMREVAAHYAGSSFHSAEGRVHRRCVQVLGMMATIDELLVVLDASADKKEEQGDDS